LVLDIEAIAFGPTRQLRRHFLIEEALARRRLSNGRFFGAPLIRRRFMSRTP
jgi:hypothetical protein